MATPISKTIDVKRRDIFAAWPEELIPPTNEERARFVVPTAEEVELICISLEEYGQLQPIAVYTVEGDMLKVGDGETRRQAIALWNSRNPDKRKRIDCKLVSGNPEEMFLATLAANRDRTAPNPINDAHNCRRLGEHYHKTDEEICMIYASEVEGGKRKPKSSAWLNNLRKLLRHDADTQLAIGAGKMRQDAALILADMAPEARTAAIETAKDETGKVTATALSKAARDAGTLTKTASLKAVEVKAAWTYLEVNNDGKVKKLAAAALAFQAGKLTEPDFFGAIRALFN